jgi:hypothetical protein
MGQPDHDAPPCHETGSRQPSCRFQSRLTRSGSLAVARLRPARVPRVRGTGTVAEPLSVLELAPRRIDFRDPSAG